jgi:hypothetical protein
MGIGGKLRDLPIFFAQDQIFSKKYESYDKLNCQVSTIFINLRSIHV